MVSDATIADCATYLTNLNAPHFDSSPGVDAQRIRFSSLFPRGLEALVNLEQIWPHGTQLNSGMCRNTLQYIALMPKSSSAPTQAEQDGLFAVMAAVLNDVSGCLTANENTEVEG
jgi:hypothetical protein